MFQYAFMLFLFQTALAVCVPRLVLYKEDNSNITLTADEPNLEPGYMGSSVEGSWIKYDAVNYTSVLSVTSGRPCNFLGEASIDEDSNNYGIRSARIPGSPLDAEIPTVTIYPLELLEGDPIVLYAESFLPTFESTLGSLISMNGATVEFFAEENYMGNSFCFIPESDWIDVFFYFDFLDTPFPISDSQSARFGCSPSAAKIFRKGQGNKYVKKDN